MKSKHLLLPLAVSIFFSCTKNVNEQASDAATSKQASSINDLAENVDGFVEIGSIDLGDEAAAEISTYDAKTQRLFVVNNSGSPRIDVVCITNPAAPVYVTSIDVTPYGGGVNSLVAKNGYVAAAIQADDKVSPGKVVVFNTTDYSVIKEVTVGSLPDMITLSPDGKYLMTANEGEPNSYNEASSVDPVGSISIISVFADFAVTTVDFSSFASQQADLVAKGFRIYGPNASFAQDIEPEYITISADSKTAWVTLQENNAIAKVNIISKAITNIFPLGFKDFSKQRNAFDPSDKDGGFLLGTWPVKGIYEPDAITVYEDGGMPYLFTANEGDTRDYDGFGEEVRVKDAAYPLDPVAFPNAAMLKEDKNLGRITVTTTMGDTDGDGDYDEMYVPGGRSFSVWNGLNGNLLFDCGNLMEQQVASAGLYDDDRSDNKGVEPEGITHGTIGTTDLLFVGMERADAVAVYKIKKYDHKPSFSQVLHTGDAPEGVVFINRNESPDNRSLLVVSSEGDGVVKIFAPQN